jgi:DNA-binding NarL/FixJ family response regulator
MQSAPVFIVADDHPMFRGALRHTLEGMGDSPVVHECGTIEDAKAILAGTDDIDLLLLDLSMPGVSGLSGLIAIKALHPELPIVIVSATQDPSTIRRALDLGAMGFVPKSARMEDMRSAIGRVLEGNVAIPGGLELGTEADPEVADTLRRMRTLTPQQTRVLGMLAEGLLNKQIAFDLSVSEATVKAHVSAVLQKLGVDSRTQAVIKISRITTDTA